MKIIFLGLSLSSSWGNGHATTYRALIAALAARGHEVLFLECDKPWYAAQRDLPDPGYCKLCLYRDVAGLDAFRADISSADLVVVGSYVPDGIEVGRLVQRTARGVTAFYDIDTPVTLARLNAGEVDYISGELIPAYDVYLSFTGGPTLGFLERHWGARRARAFYCSVDPALYRPLDVPTRWDFGYLGTYSADRQPGLERLLLEPARMLPDMRFVVAGPQYPKDIDWPANVERIEHISPDDHALFYSSQRWTLNVTRADMRAAGYSPSVRLFEAASCGVPIVSDAWDGLDTVLEIGSEIVVAETSNDVVRALRLVKAARQRISAAARARILGAHTAAHRAELLERIRGRDSRRRQERCRGGVTGVDYA